MTWWRSLVALLLCPAALIVCCVPARAAAPRPSNVLLVFSHERERWIYDPLESKLRTEIESVAGPGPTVYSEYLDAMRFVDESFRWQAVEYLRSKYAQRPIGVIVAVSPLALNFVLEHRNDLFPDTPIVFASVNVPRSREVSRLPNVTGVAVTRDLASTLDLALTLQPDTQAVFIPAGRTAQEQAWTDDARRSLQRYEGRVKIEFLTDLAIDELERRLAHLPAHSIVLWAGLMYYDADGQYFLPEEIVRQICRSANAPVYSSGESELGLGIVGGSLYDMTPVGEAAGGMVRRVLAGDAVSSIPIQVLNPNYNMVDARQLLRWGIDERRLPNDAIVRFRPPSLWRDYRWQVLGGLAVVLVQSLLIMGLLYERRGRRRAEVDSRRNLAIAADASRRATVSALTSSIAHELGQPLGAILHNTEAAERLVGSERATREVLREILSDIRTENVRATRIIDRHRVLLRSREVERAPVDLQDVVRDSLTLVDHDLRTRQVQIDVELPDGCRVVADHVLLEQVLVNLVVNAMDAMAETPPERRRIAVQGRIDAQTVELAVRDAGTGLPASVNGQPFEPFFTTKPKGLGIGLTISRSIVEAHGGELQARNNPEGGATFTMILPRDDTGPRA